MLHKQLTYRPGSTQQDDIFRSRLGPTCIRFDCAAASEAKGASANFV